MKDDIIAGLDVGSTEIRIVVGQRVGDGRNENLQIIGAVSVPTEGVNKGIVNSIEDATSSISACLEKAERLIGVPISSVWVGINDPYVKCERSRGVVAVAKSDGEISESDIARAVEAARALSVPANYEILHVIPIRYTVDSQEDVKYPIGMSGRRLEVETLIVQGLSTQIKNLTKAIYSTGLDIEDLVISPLAASEAVLSHKQKDLGVCLVNIGSTTTSLAVYEEGELIHTSVLPIGAEHITSDIAIGLRCPINLAERIKVEYGSCNMDAYAAKEEIDISDLVREEEVNDDIGTISGRYVSEIIDARVEEICSRIDAELKKIDRSGMLPAGVFLVGGGAKLNGLVDAAKKYLRLPVGLGYSRNVEVIIDKVQDQKYLCALGLVAWGDKLTDTNNGSWIKNRKVTDFTKKALDFFKNMKPNK